MTKKEKLIQFNKSCILETAELLFSKNGVRETTMDDIARASDYSKSTIYVYFKSKEEIYNHIIYAHMHDLYEAVNHCIKTSDSFEQCYFSICSRLVELYEEHPLYFEGMMGTISIDEKELSENEILQKIYETGESINHSMSLLFDKGICDHYLRQDLQVLPAVFTLWASLANTIIIAHQKETYISKRMKIDKGQFMQYGFQLLLLSIKKR